MKHVLLAIALLAPTLAAAYPNPNVNAALSAGDLVNSVLTQPLPAPMIVADTTLLQPADG